MSAERRKSDAAEILRRLGGGSHSAAHQVAEAMSLFAPRGWAMSGVWPVEGTRVALQAAADGGSGDEIDELLTRVWNEEHHRWFDWGIVSLRAAGNAHQPFKQALWRRAELIGAAIRHHRAGSYEASIPILFAQIEGLCFDAVNKPFFSKRDGVPAVDDETLAGLGANLEVARAFYVDGVKVRQSEGSLSRHGILHGRELAYDTLVNSTKVLTLTLSAAEHWKPLLDRVALQERADHETAVTGIAGLDADGRLIDDRHLPELRDALYQFEGTYMKWIMFGQRGPFDTRRELAAAARSSGLDQGRLHLDEDETGLWWHYELPSGHVLGWAARPVGRHRKPPHDSWWWDKPGAPDAAPWNRPDGWHPGDTFPIPINWEPVLVI